MYIDELKRQIKPGEVVELNDFSKFSVFDFGAEIKDEESKKSIVKKKR